MKSNKFFSFFVAFMLLIFSRSSFATPLNIVTSIKPLALIIKALLDDEDNIDILVPDSASPHGYNLKPSDIKKIHQADLVVWVGPELEIFLQKLLQNRSNTLALLDSQYIELQKFNEHGDEHHLHHSDIDPHIWLGPKQAKGIAKAVAEALIKTLPKDSARFQTALQKFNSEVDKQVITLKKSFSMREKKGYFLFHDAYGYFEKSFDLAALGHLTVNPERKPGAKTLIKVHQALQQNKASCVFSEPQFNPETVNALVRKTNTKVVMIDPLGKELSLAKHSYVDFLTALSKSYLTCF